MEEQININKFKSLLKFYKKEGANVKLKISYNGGTLIEGRITRISKFFGKYFILESKEGSKIKVFLEDIQEDTIIPTEFIKS